jgi:hypothetical protein
VFVCNVSMFVQVYDNNLWYIKKIINGVNKISGKCSGDVIVLLGVMATKYENIIKVPLI